MNFKIIITIVIFIILLIRCEKDICLECVSTIKGPYPIPIPQKDVTVSIICGTEKEIRNYRMERTITIKPGIIVTVICTEL